MLFIGDMIQLDNMKKHDPKSPVFVLIKIENFAKKDTTKANN